MTNMQFIFEQIRVGGDRNFAYLLGDREAKEAVVVDPSYTPDVVIERASSQGLNITGLINTHSHHDHTNGNDYILENTNARLVTDSFHVGEYSWEVIPTPGHCPDHICLYNKQFSVLLTGDHLFVGKIGGTTTLDDHRDQWMSFEDLHKRLPPHATIWPGHDYGCRPSSTWELKLATNPFLRASTFDEFCTIKARWATLKAELGLR